MILRFLALIAMAWAACGCGATGRPVGTTGELERAADARVLTEMATRVAVSKPGAKICRRVSAGISEHDWIRGVVTEVAGNRISVRIEDPSRFPEAINGMALTRGALISDTPSNWVPCV